MKVNYKMTNLNVMIKFMYYQYEYNFHSLDNLIVIIIFRFLFKVCSKTTSQHQQHGMKCLFVTCLFFINVVLLKKSLPLNSPPCR